MLISGTVAFDLLNFFPVWEKGIAVWSGRRLFNAWVSLASEASTLYSKFLKIKSQSIEGSIIAGHMCREKKLGALVLAREKSLMVAL